MEGVSVYLRSHFKPSIKLSNRRAFLLSYEYLSEVMINLLNASNGDFLITRREKIIRFERYVAESHYPAKCFYYYNAESFSGRLRRHLISFTKDGKYYFTPDMISDWDVIEHIQFDSSIPYFKLYEKLRIHRTSSLYSSKCS
jgi:hypothetical protein